MRSGSGEPAARSYPDSFSEFAQKTWVYRNRGRGRTMGDTTPPIGADHGPTRTVPTSVSAVASLHARPRRLADAAPGAGRHRVTVGAACGVATLGRAVAACDARCPGRFHRTSLAAHPGEH